MKKEFEGKKLLILGGIALAKDIVKYAKNMGAYVVVADYNVDSPAKEVADEGVLIDATDVKAIVEYCRNAGIDGVTTGFNDMLMPYCYEVCRQLELPYYATPKMLSMAMNKVDFKETCARYDIPVPVTYLVGENIGGDVYEKIRYPVFVKPLDASGSKGGGVCNNEEELNVQFAKAVSYSGSGNALIEDYITGKEFLLDYIAVSGEFRLLAMFDRYMCSDRDSARNYANISMAPSKSIDNYLENMNDKVIAMFKDLGFTDGLIFLQGHTEGDKITFYEMGCRLGGSFYELEQRCIGCNPVEMVVRYALAGKMVEDIRAISPTVSKFKEYAFSCNYLLKSNGEKIHTIYGLEKIADLPSYVTSLQHKKEGCCCKKDDIVDKPLISIYLVSDDMKQAKTDIKKINESIEALNKDGDSLLMDKYNPDNL